MFRSRKYTVLKSFQVVQKIPATPSPEDILLLDRYPMTKFFQKSRAPAKAKKSELVQIFNTQAGYVTAYDECFPKPKQFYFADKHPLTIYYNHVIDSCQRTC